MLSNLSFLTGTCRSIESASSLDNASSTKRIQGHNYSGQQTLHCIRSFINKCRNFSVAPVDMKINDERFFSWITSTW